MNNKLNKNKLNKNKLNKNKLNKNKLNKNKLNKNKLNNNKLNNNKLKRSISKKSSNPLNPVNPENKYLVDEFEKLKTQIRYDMDHTTDRKKRLVHSFRLQAINKVITVLLNYSETITSSAQLKGTKGVGKGTLERIDEILKSGKLSEIMPGILDKKYIEYIDELAGIYGVGERTAYELYKNYGVKSIEDLKKLYNSGKISLPDPIVMGLKYYGIVQDNIPHEEIIEIDEYLHQVLLELDPQLFGIICGSYRRMSPTSGDMDVLLVHPDIKSIASKAKNKNYLSMFVNELIQDGFIVDSLTNPDVATKYMGYCRYKDYPVRRIDIRFIPYDSYYTATLYFTGPKDFNTRMRRLALTLGYSLSEYGLTNEKDKLIKVTSEEEVFDILGMEYVSPEKRK